MLNCPVLRLAIDFLCTASEYISTNGLLAGIAVHVAIGFVFILRDEYLLYVTEIVQVYSERNIGIVDPLEYRLIRTD